VRGHVRAIVAKIRGGNNFKIKTPVGVASVRGTDFEVEYNEPKEGQGQPEAGKEGAAGEMIVRVNDGHVGVAKLGDLATETILNPG